MYYPNLKLFQEKARQGNLIPVYTELVADRETPVSAFMKLGDSPYAYLLESVESGGRDRPVLLPGEQPLPDL